MYSFEQMTFREKFNRIYMYNPVRVTIKTCTMYRDIDKVITEVDYMTSLKEIEGIMDKAGIEYIRDSVERTLSDKEFKTQINTVFLMSQKDFHYFMLLHPELVVSHRLINEQQDDNSRN